MSSLVVRRMKRTEMRMSLRELVSSDVARVRPCLHLRRAPLTNLGLKQCRQRPYDIEIILQYNAGTI